MVPQLCVVRVRDHGLERGHSVGGGGGGGASVTLDLRLSQLLTEGSSSATHHPFPLVAVRAVDGVGACETGPTDRPNRTLLFAVTPTTGGAAVDRDPEDSQDSRVTPDTHDDHDRGLPILEVTWGVGLQYGVLRDGLIVEVTALETDTSVWLTSVVVGAPRGRGQRDSDADAVAVAAMIQREVESVGAVLVHVGHPVFPGCRIMYSAPTLQGLIGPETRVVVVKCEDVGEHDGGSCGLATDVPSTHQGTTIQPLPLLHSFASRMGIQQSTLELRVAINGHSDVSTSDEMLSVPTALAVAQWSKQRARFTPEPLRVCVALATPDTLDANRVLYLPERTMQAHGFVQGDWVAFSGAARIDRATAQVCAAPNEASRPTEVPLLATQLWQQLAACSADGTWSVSRCDPPPQAKRVWLSRVKAPNGAGSDEAFAAAVVSLFRTPRVLSVGDVLDLHGADFSGFATVARLSAAVEDSGEADAPPEEADAARPHHVGHVVAEATTVLELTEAAAPVLPAATAAIMSRAAHLLESILTSCQPHPSARAAATGASAVGASPHSTLLLGPRGVGKRFWVEQLAKVHGYHLHVVSCYDVSGATAKETVANLKEALAVASECRPCVLMLEHVHALAPASTREGDGTAAPNSAAVRLARELRQLVSVDRSAATPWRADAEAPVWLVGTTHMPDDALADALVDCFVHRVQIEAPDETERADYLEVAWESVDADPTVDPRAIARDTAGLLPRDLDVLIRLAQQAAHLRIAAGSAPDGVDGLPPSFGIAVTDDDVASALKSVKREQTRAIGVPQIPNVSWADIGGLANAKKDILDTVQVPLEHPELFSAGLRRSGVLLYGPPGTGKTLLAKAVATECALNFFSVKGPELINMYIGQSEANIRAVFERARAARPCVVFFDELDSLAPSRGRSGDSGGVMDRIVSQLLAELDGLHSGNDVFIIGATNRPDLLDTALLRPGRLDKLIYLGMPDRENQERILRAQTRKFTLAAEVDLTQAVACLPPNLTGADLYALSADSMMCAIRRTIEEKEPLLAEGESLEGPVTVEQVDMARAIANLKPSVSQRELDHYEELHAQFNAKRDG
eukprot:m.415692 g.415692  ORF g.415692 m.415692 type:complete len:1085 (+) comp29716_c0_seq1:151-3405(+)